MRPSIVALMALIAIASGSLRAAALGEPVRVKSPGGIIEVVISTDQKAQLQWSVKRRGKVVLAEAPLGLNIDGKIPGVRLGEPRTSTGREEYPTFGNHPTALNHYNEAAIPVQSGQDELYQLDVRAFDDGAAVRYRAPLEGKHRIAGELTSWGLPAKATAWWAKYEHSYEEPNMHCAVDEIPAHDLAPPVTVELGGDLFVTITEANNAVFPDMGLRRGGHLLQAVFPANPKGWDVEGAVETPWRVAIIAKGLTALVNSNMLTNLCPAPPAELAQAEWIKPGRSLWQWWSIGAPKLEDQKQWVDAAKKLGFEYYLIDDGWRDWRAPGKDQWQLLKEVIEYGKSQGVASLVWVDSKEMRDAKSRRTYLEKVAGLGASGIKIDFIPAATPEIVKWYEGALKDTAELNLLCNFHGAIKPTGRRRTWPHELTREGVRGHEWHMTRYKRVQAADHDVSLPFMRYMAGPADYTPTAFDPHELVGYTWPHELAQGIVMTSPLLHFTDNYKFYLENPAVGVLRALPATWDETLVLPGSKIGKVVVFARRKGSEWWIGALNGAEATKIKIDLKFLGKGSFNAETYADVEGKDDAFDKKSIMVKGSDALEITMRPKGGYVAWIKKAGN